MRIKEALYYQVQSSMLAGSDFSGHTLEFPAPSMLLCTCEPDDHYCSLMQEALATHSRTVVDVMDEEEEDEPHYTRSEWTPRTFFLNV